MAAPTSTAAPSTAIRSSVLAVSDLHAKAGDAQILSGINLTVRSGEVHAVMGPNGAGKSTLSAAIMGKPGYSVTSGTITLDGADVLALPTWKRALAGLHLVMQYPTEIPGVGIDEMLGEALSERGTDRQALTAAIGNETSRIGLDESLIHRSVNVDFSGGEKKRNETLQLAVLKPRIVVLDELDSGLDIDALRDCARRVEEATQEDNLGVLVITHYSRIFADLQPDFVHILAKGRIVASGGPELADRLERDGYDAFTA
ncbi:MAG: Fe-S cluster assembly ATPase SufC [Actinomycetota bacterium]